MKKIKKFVSDDGKGQDAPNSYGIFSTRNRKTKLVGLQKSLGYQPPVIHPLYPTTNGYKRH